MVVIAASTSWSTLGIFPALQYKLLRRLLLTDSFDFVFAGISLQGDWKTDHAIVGWQRIGLSTRMFAKWKRSCMIGVCGAWQRFRHFGIQAEAVALLQILLHLPPTKLNAFRYIFCYHAAYFLFTLVEITKVYAYYFVYVPWRCYQHDFASLIVSESYHISINVTDVNLDLALYTTWLKLTWRFFLQNFLMYILCSKKLVSSQYCWSYQFVTATSWQPMWSMSISCVCCPTDFV